MLKKAWSGREATVSHEVKCYQYSLDSVLEFRSGTGYVSNKNSENTKANFMQKTTEHSHESGKVIALEIENKASKEFLSGMATPEERLR